jgi:hypothetical protein
VEEDTLYVEEDTLYVNACVGKCMHAPLCVELERFLGYGTDEMRKYANLR